MRLVMLLTNFQAKQTPYLLCRQPCVQGSQMMTQNYADQAAQATKLQDAASLAFVCCVRNCSMP